jgi:hypothetical protein
VSVTGTPLNGTGFGLILTRTLPVALGRAGSPPLGEVGDPFLEQLAARMAITTRVEDNTFFFMTISVC